MLTTRTGLSRRRQRRCSVAVGFFDLATSPETVADAPPPVAAKKQIA